LTAARFFEDLVSLDNLFGAFLGIRCIVAVRMVKEQQPSECPPNPSIGGILVDLQDFVIFGGHG
jgi:hypothetical protein